LKELEGIFEPNAIKSKAGRKRVEDVNPELIETTKVLLEEHTQVDPKFQSNKLFKRVTGLALRKILASSLGISIDSLPAPRTLQRMLNRNDLETDSGDCRLCYEDLFERNHVEQKCVRSTFESTMPPGRRRQVVRLH